jgi:predicted amidophosphoribosyltransferase
MLHFCALLHCVVDVVRRRLHSTAQSSVTHNKRKKKVQTVSFILKQRDGASAYSSATA